MKHQSWSALSRYVIKHFLWCENIFVYYNSVLRCMLIVIIWIFIHSETQNALPFSISANPHFWRIVMIKIYRSWFGNEVTKNLFCAQWIPRETRGPITDATYSCDSQSIYASFEDGSVFILTSSTLRLRCRINPAAYLPSNPRYIQLIIMAYILASSYFMQIHNAVCLHFFSSVVFWSPAIN